MEIVLYVLFCVVCFAACLFAEWDEGRDITLLSCASFLLISVIPVFNLIFLILAVYFIFQRHGRPVKFKFQMSKLNIVLIKGRRDNA